VCGSFDVERKYILCTCVRGNRDDRRSGMKRCREKFFIRRTTEKK